MIKTKLLLATMSAAMLLAHTASAGYYKSYYDRSIPSVVITIKNNAPLHGTAQPPFWVGMHDGSFDTYDENVALGDVASNPNLVLAPAVERLAEDVNTDPISKEFSLLQPRSPQSSLTGINGWLTPGEHSSVTLNLNPLEDRFFSYASMLIPSNDAFIANDNPEAHVLFDEYGYFVAEDFTVQGSDVVDAGTEINDEIVTNIAFLEQTQANTGVQENNVVGLHLGLQKKSLDTASILNDPLFSRANFAESNYSVASFSFKYVDLGGRVRFMSQLTTDPQLTARQIENYASATANVVSRNAERIKIKIKTHHLSSPLVSAHLHHSPKGISGPVVVNIENNIYNSETEVTIQANDVLGNLAEGKDPLLNLLNEMAADRIYISLRTEKFPNGELRGQLSLR